MVITGIFVSLSATELSITQKQRKDIMEKCNHFFKYSPPVSRIKPGCLSLDGIRERVSFQLYSSLSSLAGEEFSVLSL